MVGHGRCAWRLRCRPARITSRAGDRDSDRVHANRLRAGGPHVAGRHRVRRLMRKMGLTPIYQPPKTSQPHPEHKVYPYLLNGLAITHPSRRNHSSATERVVWSGSWRSVKRSTASI